MTDRLLYDFDEAALERGPIFPAARETSPLPYVASSSDSGFSTFLRPFHGPRPVIRELRRVMQYQGELVSGREPLAGGLALTAMVLKMFEFFPGWIM